MSDEATRTPATGASVVSVAYMTGPTLFEHVESVLAEPLARELILIDNGSPAEDAARLREIAAGEPRLRLFQWHGNVGFAQACNMGAAQARTDNLLFLNPDAVLWPGTLQALMEARAARPERPVVIGGRVLNADGSEQRGGRRGEVTPMSTFMTLTRLAERSPRWDRYRIHREHEPSPSKPVAVPTVSGACFFMTGADYDAVGGFDTGYFLHVEDIDLCWRVRRSGGEVLHHPHATVTHYGHTSMTEPIYVEYWKGRGLARYFRKRAGNVGEKAVALMLGPVLIIVSVGRALLQTAQGKTTT